MTTNPRYSSISGIFISIAYYQRPIIHNNHIPTWHIKFIIDRSPIHRKTLVGTIKLNQSHSAIPSTKLFLPLKNGIISSLYVG